MTVACRPESEVVPVLVLRPGPVNARQLTIPSVADGEPSGEASVRQSVRGSVTVMQRIGQMTERRPTLAKQLFIEWEHLRRDRQWLLHAAGWQLVEGELDDLDQVLSAVGNATRNTEATETAMRALVLHAADDAFATRVVAQRLMPGLIATSRLRYSRDSEAFAELFGAAWIAIRNFSPNRNPACLAAALLTEADDQAFRRGWRRHRFDETPWQACELELPAPTPHSPADELDGVLQRAAALGLSSDRLDDLRCFASGRPIGELAAELKISERAVRYRRNRATREVRQLLQSTMAVA